MTRATRTARSRHLAAALAAACFADLARAQCAAGTGWIDGEGTSTTFRGPTQLAYDGVGVLYVAEIRNFVVRAVSLATPAVVTTLAGQVQVAGSADGVGSAASFKMPYGLAYWGGAWGAPAVLFVADANKLRMLTLDTRAVTTIAGVTAAGFVDGIGTNAQLSGPQALAVDNAGNLYATDVGNKVIRMISNPDSGSASVSTLAGSPTGAKGYQDGVGSNALFSDTLGGLVFDGVATLYIGDGGANDLVRSLAVTSAGLGPSPTNHPAVPLQTVKTVAGGKGCVTYIDGAGTNACLGNALFGLAYAAGVIYVSDTMHGAVRTVTLGGANPAVRTLSGSGVGGAGCSPGVGNASTYMNLVGLAVDVSGNVYAADMNAAVISLIVPSAPAPAPATWFVGGMVPSVSASLSASRTVSPSKTVRPTVSKSRMATISVSPSCTPSVAASPSYTPSTAASPSVEPSVSPSPSLTASVEASPTSTESVSPSATLSATPSETVSVSATASLTSTPSLSLAPSESPTGSTEATPSASSSLTPSPTTTVTPDVSPSHSTISTPSETPSVSATPAGTPSASDTPSVSASGTRTTSDSATPSLTPSPSYSISSSETASPVATATASASASASVSSAVTSSVAASPSTAATDSASSSRSVSVSATATPTTAATVSSTASTSMSVSATIVSTVTPSSSPSATASSSASSVATASAEASSSVSPSASPSASATETSSVSVSSSESAVATPTASGSPTASSSVSPTASASLSPSSAVTTSVTPSPTPSGGTTTNIDVVVAISGVPAGSTAASACTSSVVNSTWTAVGDTVANVTSSASSPNAADAAANPLSYCSLTGRRRLDADGARSLQARTLSIRVFLSLPQSAGVAGITAAAAAAAAMTPADFTATLGALVAIFPTATFTVASVSSTATCVGGGSACSLPAPDAVAASSSGLTQSQQLGLGLGIGLGLVLILVAALAAACGVCSRKRNDAYALHVAPPAKTVAA